MGAANNSSLDGFRFRFLAKPAATFLEKAELNKSSSCLWKKRPVFDSGITENRIIFESGKN